MGFYVYILRCSDRTYYTGHTDNLEAREAAHQAGQIIGYTSRRMPVSLVFSEEFPTRYDALERERQIKGWSRRKKEALINKDWDALTALSKSRGSTSSPRTE
ncbi:MAG: GIY-YIG nuclease family protein [Chloroflexi bacterium]|nr:GIY-YIG nuclease family protein [Chloroflexota bacterium]